MKKVSLNIAGMTCEHCEKTIKNAITKSGAMAESVSYKNGEAIACFNPQLILDEAIVNSINQTGNYKVTAYKEC
jgi:copper chaperone CopZ